MNSFLKPHKKVKEGFVGQRMIVLPPDTIKKVGKNPLTNNLYLTAAGFYPHAVHHDRERKNGCKEYILIYCTEGEGLLFFRGNQYEFIPNSFAIIPPNEPHHYRSSQTNPWSIYWVHFLGETATELYSRYSEDQKSQVRSIAYDTERLSLFNKVMNLLEGNVTTKELEMISISLLYFLSSLIYNFEADTPSKNWDTVDRSIEFMKENIKSTLTLDQLAANQNLSVSRYSELFKQKTGNSAISYFIRLKIQKSCQLLYFSDMTLKQICLEVGFQDQFYFSRTFKKIMGISPSKYKSTYKS